MTEELPESIQQVIQNEDYLKLSEMMEAHLSSMKGIDPDEMDKFYRTVLAGEVNLEALVFFGVTRASTVASNNSTLLELLSGMWLEGFLMGKTFGRNPSAD